ncbi:MAG: hypothetical protein A2Z16_14620 [Chloroflexi bacterium RBG_16_54_18]|nr:MAG: hypothetical protein A2Z16_14620 [Chloroflexi bacterium RBG_16_54_18]
MRDDRLYLVYILECIERIEAFTVEGEQGFLEDIKTQDAVLRNLHTLSESVLRISEDLRARHTEIDWKLIMAFRNVIVHDYLGIDLHEIWDIVLRDLPNLKDSIRAILNEL